METKNFNKLFSILDKIERNIRLTNSIVSEKSESPHYPDLQNLETSVKYFSVPCKLKYACSGCLTKKRNKCWRLSQKVSNRKALIAGIPYGRGDLSKLKISSLWVIASHLKIAVIRKTQSALVDSIMKKQYAEGQKVEVKKK